MKVKKWAAAWLALVLTLTLLPLPSRAAVGSFSDISDPNTARNVEVLRLMGVVDGVSATRFDPNGTLTRAQFCKMAVTALGKGSSAAYYSSFTIFPDVKATHWASGYVNLAVRGEPNLLSGYPDGTFKPDSLLTYDQAVTILLRVLGYTDSDIGAVWPDGYLALADSLKLSKNLSLQAGSTITRAQAAQLFANLLTCVGKSGSTFCTLGTETTLLSVSGGKLRTADGEEYELLYPMTTTVLNGLKGYVVTSGSKALTFVPSALSATTVSADAAVIVDANGSTAGFAALAGSTSYALYKNGQSATAADMRKGDVATYSAAANAIYVCDTRVSVYYEGCEPSPSEPSVITVLGGTTLNVLPGARASVAAFKPGKTMTISLTADGQVAAAQEGGSANALAIVRNGAAELICGGNLLPLKLSYSTALSLSDYENQIVRVSAASEKSAYLSVQKTAQSKDLNVVTRKLGDTPLADGVMIFDGGKQVALSQYTTATVAAEDISFVHTNWAGEIDLVVIGAGGSSVYGIAAVTTSSAYSEFGSYEVRSVSIACGDGKTVGPFETGYDCRSGAFVAATVRNGKFTSLTELTCLPNVPFGVWIGDSTITYGGRTYTVSSHAGYYNQDAKGWTTLDKARAYSTKADLYVLNGTVCIVSVKG